jgi:TetR/AcrR family transcriptional regulator, transcriptional repressor for nem operon
MRRSRAETEVTRQQAVAAASRLARLKGLENVSVEDVMQAVGRTGGAFYRHFSSKDALLVEACQHMFDDFAAHQAERFGAEPKSIDELVSRYLSLEHRDQPAEGCPVPAMLSSTAHQSAEIRSVFTDAVRSRVERIGELNGSAESDAYYAAAAAMFGALALSRALNDPALSAQFLRATTRHVIQSLADSKHSVEPPQP